MHTFFKYQPFCDVMITLNMCTHKSVFLTSDTEQYLPSSWGEGRTVCNSACGLMSLDHMCVCYCTVCTIKTVPKFYVHC